MKLISTDFSNLGKKTIYDFGDDEAIDELLKEHNSTREEITREFFDDAEKGVRFIWLGGLAETMIDLDKNAKQLFDAASKELDKIKKNKVEMFKKYGRLVD